MAPTAIIVPVAEAEPATDRWRRRYTPDGADGMPPHVTVLYPFVDENVLVGDQIRQVDAALGDFQPFDFSLVSLDEFAASDAKPCVLYLTPDPPEPFREMTDALVMAFPDFPPYGGAFARVIPHLTVANDREAPLSDIRDVVGPALPITARAVEARIMRYADDGWRTKSRIDLRRRERDSDGGSVFV
jgi:2'-5' RNA ligase